MMSDSFLPGTNGNSGGPAGLLFTLNVIVAYEVVSHSGLAVECRYRLFMNRKRSLFHSC